MVMEERTVTLDAVPLSPRSLSPTSASTWQQCELKFAFVYLHRWQEPVTLPQLIGNTVHRAVELLYGSAPGERSRAAASEFMQLSLSEQLADDHYSHLFADDTALANEVIAAGEDALAGLFALEDPATITIGPEGLEVWVRAELYGAPIRGRIDRLYDAHGAQVIADYKTGKVPPSRFTERAFLACGPTRPRLPRPMRTSDSRTVSSCYI
jgi:putative RecB family exonuclease